MRHVCMALLDRQVDALQQAGIPPERIYLDKKSGATTHRPGLKAALTYARAGDVIVVHTLCRSRHLRDDRRRSRSGGVLCFP